ncbi:hypothetical protein N7G274_008402 [Stereocaulon virgatum]|uniref:Major facilitator superfamily (MFS) profile domain-containing protein n=1 Tax=Stereocaulon virgatum TaxID=373712 RepID=A0ABR4A1E0_9LECA
MADITSVRTSPEEATGHLSSWRLAIVIGSLCLGTFLLALDMNIIGVAIPKITSDFHSLEDVAWYGSVYLLTVTAFQPLGGSLYKFFNIKVVYLSSIALFEFGSILCAVAPASKILILGRAVLGVGAAGLLQGALAIIGHVVELKKIPMYQGIVVSSFGVSVCIGPVLGGAFTDKASWRWCFWINVPIGVTVFVAILGFVRLNTSINRLNRDLPLLKKLKHMDPIGTLLFLGSICCLLLALQWGGQTIGWQNSRIIGLFVGFGLLIMGFSFLQWRRGDYATIPVRVLRKRSILMGALVLMPLGMSSMVYAYYLPIYFQSIQGVTPIASGVRFIALVLPQILGLMVVGMVVTKWGYYVPYMVAGIMINIIGAGLLTTIGIDTQSTKWISYMVVNGLGIGMAMQLPYTALQVVLDPEDVATGNAIAVFSYQLGGSVAVSIGQNLFVNKLKESISQSDTKVPVSAVIEAGATGLTQLASSPEILRGLRLAYAISIRRTLVFALASACIALPFACNMQWLNLKTVAEEISGKSVPINCEPKDNDECEDTVTYVKSQQRKGST